MVVPVCVGVVCVDSQDPRDHYNQTIERGSSRKVCVVVGGVKDEELPSVGGLVRVWGLVGVPLVQKWGESSNVG